MSRGETIKITILFFGAYREMAGIDKLECEIVAPAEVAHAFTKITQQIPALSNFERHALFAVNEEYARRNHSLHDGDTLAIFPPVSGGESGTDIFEITREPIDKVGLERRLLTSATGAIVTFDGVVRNQTLGREVVKLQYEAYVPMALKEIRRIGMKTREHWPEIERIGIIHRFGELKISESSVVIVIAAPHRDAAFEACRFAIDQIKQTVPIWKKELFANGEEWVEGQSPSTSTP